MANKKSQAKAGIPAARRGQQMGDERSSIGPDERDDSDEITPPLSGLREDENQFFADDSAQAAGGDASRPRTVSPSTPAASPTGVKKGEPGGERAFKQRAAKKARE